MPFLLVQDLVLDLFFYTVYKNKIDVATALAVAVLKMATARVATT
jgi:hypothetical protein